MSGCTDLYAVPFQTVDMTGANAALPGGDWYMTDDAYPQLKCMALHTEETYILRSEASVIPLILPMGINLNDIPKAGEEGTGQENDVKISGTVEVRIPEQIDGDAIQWTDPDRMTIQEDGKAVVELD